MFAPVQSSMIGRAEKNGLVDFNIVNIRDFSQDKHKKTDDTPFGGGHGMVMMTDPIFRALRSVGASECDADGTCASESGTKPKRLIYMSPRGKVLDQKKIDIPEVFPDRAKINLCIYSCMLHDISPSSISKQYDVRISD